MSNFIVKEFGKFHYSNKMAARRASFRAARSAYFKKICQGFTLIEILVSAIILATAVAAFFAVFIYTMKLRIYSSNELRMSTNASSWLERVRSGSTSETEYNDPAFTAQANIDLNDAFSIAQEDYNSNWLIAREGNVDIVDPGDKSKGAFYTTENIDLGSGVNFKKIAVTVLWDEED